MSARPRRSTACTPRSLEQTFGNYSWVRTIGAANLGFSDNFALRLSAVYDDRDSFTRNIGPSASQPGNVGLTSGRANFAFRLADGRLRGNLRLDYFDWQTDNNAVKNRSDLVTSDPFTIEEDARSFMDQQGHRKSLELHYELTDSMELRLLSSRQRGKTEDQTDGDRTATALPQPPTTNVGRVAYARTGFKTWIHELNLLSTGEGPMQWVVGALLHARGHSGLAAARQPQHHATSWQSNSTIITHADNESKSLFGQVNSFVTDTVELIGGARYSEDTQYYNRIALPGAPLPPGTDRIGPPASSDEITGKLGANLHVTDDLMYYATISKGYKAGGVNLTLGTPNFKPEKNLVYELGMKIDDAGSAPAHQRQPVLFRLHGHPVLEPVQRAAADAERSLRRIRRRRAGGHWPLWRLGPELRPRLSGCRVLEGRHHREYRHQHGAAGTEGRRPAVLAGCDAECRHRLRLVVCRRHAHAAPAVVARRASSWPRHSPVVATIVPSRNLLRRAPDLGQRRQLAGRGLRDEPADKTYIASQIQNSTSATGGIIYGAPRQYGLRARLNFGD